MPSKSPFTHFNILAGAVALLTLASAGCAKKTSADFAFLNGTEPESIDPVLITGQPEFRVVDCLFEGLLRLNAKGEAEPGLAERWEVSQDKLVYTFFLRPGIKWSNGEPITVEDFINSWERALRPSTASLYAQQLWYIKNARPYNEGKLTDFAQVGVKVLDAASVQITLEAPTPFFLDLAAFPTLRPVHLGSLKKYGEDQWLKPGRIVTSGAYTVEEWRIYDRIRMVKNPHYWDHNNVALKTVDALALDDPMAMFNFMHTGQAQLMLDKSSIPTALIGEMKNHPYFHPAPFLGNYFLRFNCTKGPFKDPRVRQAVALAIDKAAITERITRLGEVPATSLVPPGCAGYTPPPGPGYDLEKARQLLAEAGHPGGKNFPNVTYLYNKKDIDNSVAVELQNMLKQGLGINLSLVNQEWKVYLGSLNTLNYDIARSSWVGDYNDPNTFLDMFITDGGNNRTGWSNKQYDGLIAAAAKELDPARRYAILAEAETLLVSGESVIAPLYYYVGVQMYDPQTVGGVEANLLDVHPIQFVYLKDKSGNRIGAR